MTSSNQVGGGTVRTYQPRRREGRPVIRTTFQFMGTLSQRGNEDLHGVWIDAIKSTCGWLRDRSPDRLPQEAWDGLDFECGVPGHRIDCASLVEEGNWAVRLMHPDAPHRDHEAVPGRTWTTEICLHRSGTAIDLGLRSYCTSQPYCDAEIVLTRPQIVRFMASSFALSVDRRPLQEQPWYLNSESDLEAFYQFLIDPLRTLPVYLLTEVDQRRVQEPVNIYMLDEREVARRALGLAHIAVLPQRMSFAWTDRVGRTWSAFGGAVRTYGAGLNFDTQSPAEHPLAMVEKIEFWKHGEMNGWRAFATFLMEKAHQAAAHRQVDWGDCRFFTDVRRRKAELARDRASGDADWRSLYEEEIAALQEKVEESVKEAEEYNDDAIKAANDLRRVKEENDNLRWQIDSLRSRLAEKTGVDPDEDIDIPTDYEEMPEWIDRNLVGRLLLHPRALRGLRQAIYDDVELVYRAILLLANEYRNMKLGQDGAKATFDSRLGELGLRIGPSISQERAGEEGDTYFVMWPQDTERKQFLEMHLRKGSTKDDHYCLGIYFFWDDDTRQVVIGWLPSHLDTRAT